MSYCLAILHKNSLRTSHNHHYAISLDWVHPLLLPAAFQIHHHLLTPSFCVLLFLTSYWVQFVLPIYCWIQSCPLECVESTAEHTQKTSAVHRSSEVRSQESPSHSAIDGWLAWSWAGGHSCCGTMTTQITPSPEDPVWLWSSLTSDFSHSFSIFYRMVLEPWLGWGSCDNRRSTCGWAGHSHFSSSLHADQPPSALATINCSKRRRWWHLRAALIDGYGDSKLESRLLTHPLERMITVGSAPGVYEIYNWSLLFPPMEQKTLSCPHSVLATTALGLSYHTAHCCSSHSSDGEVSCLCPPSPRPGAM